MPAAAPRRASYRSTMNTSAKYREAYRCINRMITTPAPHGKGHFTIMEIESLTVAQLNKITVGLKIPWRSPLDLHWKLLEHYFETEDNLDLIPVCEYFFSNLKREGKSRAYDMSMGVPMNIVAYRSISCCPPSSATVGYVVNSSLVHHIDPVFPTTWLEWRKAVGSGHIHSAIVRLNRAVANQALTQSQADLILNRANFAPLKRLLK
jgi:hypothetical protein